MTYMPLGIVQYNAYECMYTLHGVNCFCQCRKMQSLRREFARARVLMELVLERELLKKVKYAKIYILIRFVWVYHLFCILKADMELSREIFEQHLRNLSEKAGGAGKELLVERPIFAADKNDSLGEGNVKIKIEDSDKMDVVESSERLLDDVGLAETEPVDDPFRYKFRFPHLIPMVCTI